MSKFYTMRTILKIICVFSIAVLFLACEKENNPELGDTISLIGYWVDPQINDSIFTFEKAEKLPDNDYGLAFKEGQEFLERKNSGWCGTPPISYSDYAGTWNLDGPIINITVGYWGRIVDYKWRIISIEKNKLIIYKINEEYHLEE